MFEELVRCPYCVQGNEFRPMQRGETKEFVCPGCGHSATPDDPYVKCHCERCREMNRMSVRRRGPEDDREPRSANLPGRW
jgi:hypothetical protein